MSGKPAARLSDPTSCPVPGHGTPALQSGSPDVQFNNLPAARSGDIADCGQAIDGAFSSAVFINGKNAATLGSTLSHGGVVIGGSGDVIIGDTVIAASFEAPLPKQQGKWIGFRIPAQERYTGLSCIAHFDDGTSLTGVFNNDNSVMFNNPSALSCTKIELAVSVDQPSGSVTETILSMITGARQG
jgi:uncharacterized Zn-binding protein involved in type VI secretion